MLIDAAMMKPSSATEKATTDHGEDSIRQPVNSQQLLGKHRFMHIAHNGTVYVLRATSKGGLILTK